MLTSLNAIHDMARSRGSRRLVLAAAHDQQALEAIVHAARQQIVSGILVGDAKKIESIANAQDFDLGVFRIIDEPDNDLAASIAVKMVRDGEADILMKGNLGTPTLLKAVLNKDYGLRTGELISHLALFETPSYHKIFGLTDAGMNIFPDLDGKVSLIRSATACLRQIGVERPKVAVLSAAETVNPDMRSSLDAAVLSKMSDRGQLKGCIVDGPLALDNAISSKSAALKGIDSQVAGDADLLLADNIDAANAIYKTLVYFSQVSCAAIILGARAPIVLTSRADSETTKLNSIALAAAL